jgi:hypothetical protein
MEDDQAALCQGFGEQFDAMVAHCFPVHGIMFGDTGANEFFSLFVPILILSGFGFVMLFSGILTPPKPNQSL